jgi:hypothetical protein
VTVVIVAGAVALVVLSTLVVVWSLLSQRVATRYRRRDALDIVHHLARRRGSRSRRR